MLTPWQNMHSAKMLSAIAIEVCILNQFDRIPKLFPITVYIQVSLAKS